MHEDDTSAEPEEGPFEESAEDLYENAPCGYLSTRLDGLIVKVNQTLLTWTGYQRDELIGRKRFYELLSAAGRIYHETHYAPLLQMQGFVRELSLDVVCSDGRPLPVLINAMQKKDAAGKPRSIRATLFNLTERKLYERELLQARRKAEQMAQAKATLLSTLSHEIRNPLNAITAATRLLGMTGLSDKQSKYVHILGSSSGNLLALVNDILDWSKIEAGKLSLEQREFDPRELISGLVNGLAARAEEKKLQLLVDVDERLPASLLGDPVKIGQILTNLVSNALKFTEKGSVRVVATVRSLQGDECSVNFQVIDTGIGISPDRITAIFEEYTQANYDIGMRYGGTGLGLSISRKLLELHGSKMTVTSEVGVGSRFAFDLRLKAGTRAPGKAPPAAAPEPVLSGLRVLVVEDSEINTYVLSRWLERWGVVFDTVGNGKQAVEQVQKGNYALVLMDLHMPELDGYDALKAIRALPDERLRQLPVIALSASARAWQESRIKDSGFTDFIGKPFDADMLWRRIALYTSRDVPNAAKRPPAPVRRPPETDESAVALPPDYSLTRLGTRAGNDPQARVALARLTLLELEQARPALRSALTSGARDEYERLWRGLAGAIRLLDAHALAAALRRAKGLLTSNKRDPARMHAAAFAVDWEMETLIEVLAPIVSEDS
ncbi:PAS domain S-box-containing protein [Stigmatella aurantiaca]|uniref:histidine kinase n=1 Tax=Stigmatella aurantiaca TaxID=41 RepID=A0A1H7ZPR9_STIAU|nr:ATP-binding protein [Stigmatella aurantiaca]SEM60276.1 PAS domain S-box-containing protein [Stigmatella aurantiaca]